MIKVLRLATCIVFMALLLSCGSSKDIKNNSDASQPVDSGIASFSGRWAGNFVANKTNGTQIGTITISIDKGHVSGGGFNQTTMDGFSVEGDISSDGTVSLSFIFPSFAEMAYGKTTTALEHMTGNLSITQSGGYIGTCNIDLILNPNIGVSPEPVVAGKWSASMLMYNGALCTGELSLSGANRNLTGILTLAFSQGNAIGCISGNLSIVAIGWEGSKGYISGRIRRNDSFESIIYEGIFTKYSIITKIGNEGTPRGYIGQLTATR